MFAKRIICLLLIAMMTVCFVSCDFEDVFMKPSAQPTASPGNDSKPDDNDPLSILRYANKSDAGEENEDVVNAFLASDDRFKLAEGIDPFTGKKSSGFMHIPENSNCDLMFAALLERKK